MATQWMLILTLGSACGCIKNVFGYMGSTRQRVEQEILVEKKFGYLAKDMVESFLPVGSIQTLVTVKDKAGKFGRILGKFKIHDGKEDRQTTINEWMIENHYAVAYFGQSKEAIADEHLINYEKVIENVDLTERRACFVYQLSLLVVVLH